MNLSSPMGSPVSTEKARATEARLNNLVNNLGGMAIGSFVYYTAADSGTVNSTSESAITSLTGLTVAAVPYLMRGTIIVKQGAAGPGNQAVRIVGPTVSQMEISWFCIEGGTVFSSGVSGALESDLTTGAIPLNTTGELHFDGIIIFSAAGSTFGMNARCVTANADTWVVGQGSYIEMRPI